MLFNTTVIDYAPMTVQFKDSSSIELCPPKIGVIKRINNVSTIVNNEAASDELLFCISALLSDNHQKRTISAELIRREFGADDIQKLLSAVMSWLKEIKNMPELSIPKYASDADEDVEVKYTAYTNFEKNVIDYTNLNINQVDELDLVSYLIYLRDAYIYGLSQTKKGREYLEDAWYMSQTDMDVDTIKKISESR